MKQAFEIEWEGRDITAEELAKRIRWYYYEPDVQITVREIVQRPDEHDYDYSKDDGTNVRDVT